MPKIENKGWELLIQRIEEQSRPGQPTRTYGKYQVFIDGKKVSGLSGFMCERQGPGDNSKAGDDNDVRIAQGRYPISTQFGKRYVSIDYKKGQEHPMPGFLLQGTGKRTAILIHPAHKPRLYISSVGCLNPTKKRKADQDIEFEDLQARVIALLDSLRQFDKNAFKKKTHTGVTSAFVVIDGEPGSGAGGLF